jgi:multidrug resistance efflux pump
MREAQFRLDSSRLELEAARTRTKLNEASLRREQAQLDAMGISAPLNGVVLDVRKRAGETVDEGSPVLTIVSVDPLWLDVSVPIREATGISVGQSAEVIWEDIDDKTPMTAHVIYKAPAGNAGARKIQLRLEVPNPNQIPSGMHGSLRFKPAGSSSAPSGTADTPGTKMGGK